jgi:hypothetical protein
LLKRFLRAVKGAENTEDKSREWFRRVLTDLLLYVCFIAIFG